MDTTFDINIAVKVKPIWWNTIPQITYGIDNHTINTIQIDNPITLTYSLPLDIGSHAIWLEFNNKNYNDCQLDKNLDMAVEIESIQFESIELKKFIYLSEYEPIYPEPWYSEQTVRPSKVVKSVSYLGWNGKWSLQFQQPIFTWIHQIEGMGWIWDIDLN